MKKVYILLYIFFLIVLSSFTLAERKYTETFEDGGSDWTLTGNSSDIDQTAPVLAGSYQFLGGDQVAGLAVSTTNTSYNITNATVQYLFRQKNTAGSFKIGCDGSSCTNVLAWLFFSGTFQYRTKGDSFSALPVPTGIVIGQVYNITLTINASTTAKYCNVTVYINGSNKGDIPCKNDIVDGSFLFYQSGSSSGTSANLNIDNIFIDDFVFVPPLVLAPLPNVSLVKPQNATTNNTFLVNFTYNVSFQGATPDNCSLFTNITGGWVRNITNQTAILNNTNNTFENITVPEGHTLWNVHCGDNNTNSSFALNNFTYIIDTVSPQLVDNFVNNTVLFRLLLTGQFNFSDNERLSSVNFTIPTNGNQIIFNKTGINASTFQHNLSFNVSALPAGNHTLRIVWADIHTAKSLRNGESYDPKLGGLLDSRYLKYRFKAPYKELDLKLSLKDGSIFDKWDYTVKKDRYEEGVKPQNPSSTQTIIVESTEKIQKVTATEGDDYGGDWLIIDEHWKDFKLKDEPLARVSKIEFISDYYVEVTIVNITNNINYLRFESTGDLNVVNITYNFFKENVTEIFSTPILNNIETELFLDFNGSGHSAPSVVILEWNNTNFTATQTINNATLARYRQNITPSLDLNTSNKEVNISHKWYFNLTNPETTAPQNQTIQQISLDNCSDLTTVALNYTIKDEGNQSLIDTADVTGTYNYNAGSGTARTFNLVVTNQNNFTICIFPASVTLTGNYTLVYSATDYQQRSFIDNAPSITNITQDIDLFLLGDADGIFGIFRTINTIGQTISDTLITMIRVISGSPQTVEIESTDDSGLATFFVDPDVTYSFVFLKTGFETQTFNLRITTSEIITVTMISTEEALEQPEGIGILFSFTPINTVPINNTDTNFTFNLSSNFRVITSCNFTLRNSTNILANINGTFTGVACTANITFNTGNQTIITAEASYTLNETINRTISQDYVIINTYIGQFSLKNFFDDLDAFGEAGFNDTTRIILALIIIISITSITASKIQIVRDAEPLIILTWGLSFIFASIGWLTINSTTMPNIQGFDIQKWFLFILITILSLSYIIKREFF